MSEGTIKPVTFKIILDTEDARKQLDALNKGGQKGTSDAKGVPPAPKPPPGQAGRAVGERGGTQGAAPGRAAMAEEGTSALSMMRAAGGQIGGGASGAGLEGFLSTVNKAVLDPGGAAIGAAETGMGALETAGAVAGIIVASAVFLEQIVPLILEALSDSLPDMPFFKEWAKEFDDMVSDKITEVRTWISAVIPSLSETVGIDRAILQAGGTLPNQADLMANLFGINWQQKRFNADVEKEIHKIEFKGIIKSLVESVGS